MSSITKIQEEIIEDFAFLDDWEDKYTYIIELAKGMEALEDSEKVDERLIRGCQSRVWMKAIERDGNLVFEADSDAIISKGLIALLLKVFSGHTAEEIAQAEPFFLERIGLHGHLSPNRSNGLASMVRTIKNYASELQKS